MTKAECDCQPARAIIEGLDSSHRTLKCLSNDVSNAAEEAKLVTRVMHKPGRSETTTRDSLVTRPLQQDKRRHGFTIVQTWLKEVPKAWRNACELRVRTRGLVRTNMTFAKALFKATAVHPRRDPLAGAVPTPS